MYPTKDLVLYIVLRLEKKFTNLRKGFLQPVILPDHQCSDNGMSPVELEAMHTRLKDMADELHKKSELAVPCDWRSLLLAVDQLIDM